MHCIFVNRRNFYAKNWPGKGIGLKKPKLNENSLLSMNSFLYSDRVLYTVRVQKRASVLKGIYAKLLKGIYVKRPPLHRMPIHCIGPKFTS